ncbi:hypothetical protein IV203_018819 [Nitzschia inconspicua]|uniref:Uncharacterized protein n=1 Tax=Nitzschia inconspicua TaxID=303405 RepID=A0A9K3M5W2_9STRA|nr:hypothetical protein IV203_018819 [Nitzschia inconspicua]
MNSSSPEETETANTTVVVAAAYNNNDSIALLSENDVNRQSQQSLSSSLSSASNNNNDPILSDAVVMEMDMMDWDGDDGPTLTGRPPKCLYLSCDADHLNKYQCLIRQNMEFFEATQHDLSIKVRGRNKQIVLGQVGLRCMHCCCKVMSPGQQQVSSSSSSSTTHAPKGSVYYPQNLLGIYQSAQTLANGHWIASEENSNQTCTAIQPFVRQQMRQLKECTTVERQYSQGKEFWATQAAVLGVIEHPQWGLRFKPLDTTPPHV